MPADRGKEFEDLFKTLAENAGVSVVRFHDTLYKYKDVKNPCDFVISRSTEEPSILIECKATEKSSFSLSKFTQYDDLLELKNFTSYLVIWFVEYKKVLAFSLEDVVKLKERNVKSINPTKLGNISYVNPIDICNIFYRIKPGIMEVEKLWKRT